MCNYKTRLTSYRPSLQVHYKPDPDSAHALPGEPLSVDGGLGRVAVLRVRVELLFHEGEAGGHRQSRAERRGHATVAVPQGELPEGRIGKNESDDSDIL